SPLRVSGNAKRAIAESLELAQAKTGLPTRHLQLLQSWWVSYGLRLYGNVASPSIIVVWVHRVGGALGCGNMNQTSGNCDQRGLAALVMLLRLQGVSVDPGQIRHQLGTDAIGVPEMLRCANQLGLKARESKTRWDRLARTPLPGIAPLRDGGFLLLGRA